MCAARLVFTLDLPEGRIPVTRGHAGVLAAGDLEVLVEPGPPGSGLVCTVITAAPGRAAEWRAALAEAARHLPLAGARVEARAEGAPPPVTRLRFEEAAREALGLDASPAAVLDRWHRLQEARFSEATARERARGLVDPGTWQELLGPWARLTSPYVEELGRVPAPDDGVVVGLGRVDGRPAVVVSQEGRYLGGSTGEVGGARFLGALRLAGRLARDREPAGRPAVLLALDTGGVRLQEANAGLLALAEILEAIADLREAGVPLLALVGGRVGCFGGAGFLAAACDAIVMSERGRLGLTGPAVIERLLGREEFDSSDRELVWQVTGGRSRYRAGMAARLVGDRVAAFRQAAAELLRLDPGELRAHRRIGSAALARVRLRELDCALASGGHAPGGVAGALPAGAALPAAAAPPARAAPPEAGETGSRALEVLRLVADPDSLERVPAGDLGLPGDLAPGAVVATGRLAGEPALFLVTDAQAANPRLPHARDGYIGPEEAYKFALAVHAVVESDRRAAVRRPIVLVVDTPGTAPGRFEEQVGMHEAAGAPQLALVEARRAGHPVVAVVAGRAVSGGFLCHGLQADRILALARGTYIHAMAMEGIERVTGIPAGRLAALAARSPVFSPRAAAVWRLGGVDELVLDPGDLRTAVLREVAEIRVLRGLGLEARLGPQGRGALGAQRGGRPLRALVLARLEEESGHLTAERFPAPHAAPGHTRGATTRAARP